MDSSNCSSPIKISDKTEEMPFIPIPQIDEADLEICNKLGLEKINDIFDFNKLKVEEDEKKFTVSFPVNKICQPINPAYHIDPQLKNYFNDVEDKDFRATFGPNKTKVKYLNVEPNDIFLFFGYYDGDEQTAKHTIFGYMQVGEIITLERKNKIITINLTPEKKNSSKEQTKEKTQESIEEKYPFLKNQPHWVRFWDGKTNSETIYIASKNIDFGKGITNLKGFGMFKYNEQLCLSRKDNDETKALCNWGIKGFTKDISIKMKKGNRSFVENKEYGYITIPKRYQEIVLKDSTGEQTVINWAKGLILGNANNWKKSEDLG